MAVLSNFFFALIFWNSMHTVRLYQRYINAFVIYL